jgi:hypothetical protein
MGYGASITLDRTARAKALRHVGGTPFSTLKLSLQRLGSEGDALDRSIAAIKVWRPLKAVLTWRMRLSLRALDRRYEALAKQYRALAHSIERSADFKIAYADALAGDVARSSSVPLSQNAIAEALAAVNQPKQADEHPAAPAPAPAAFRRAAQVPMAAKPHLAPPPPSFAILTRLAGTDRPEGLFSLRPIPTDGVPELQNSYSGGRIYCPVSPARREEAADLGATIGKKGGIYFERDNLPSSPMA